MIDSLSNTCYFLNINIKTTVQIIKGVDMKKTFILENLDCANCAAKIENAVASLEGVISATVSFMSQKMTVEATEEDFTKLIDKIEAVVKKVDADVTFRK